jgi:hypothetical protein
MALTIRRLQVDILRRTRRTIIDSWIAPLLGQQLLQLAAVTGPDFLAPEGAVVRRIFRDAVVLSIDEKSQIQALDRTQSGLPLKKGRCGTMTHDNQRHGTTTLFAALNILDSIVFGRCMQKHRHQEFIRFLITLRWTRKTGQVAKRDSRP